MKLHKNLKWDTLMKRASNISNKKYSYNFIDNGVYEERYDEGMIVYVRIGTFSKQGFCNFIDNCEY